MRTKNESKESPEGDEAENADAILASADREELEQLREERDKRLAAEKVFEETAKRTASSVTLNLPPAAGKGVQVGGRMFYNGHTYQVSNDIKWTLEEVERRCWSHESSLHESENKGRAQRQVKL